MKYHLPKLKTDNPDIDRAFELALEDLTGNVAQFMDGLLDGPAPVILAGKGYDTPWTRDASINVWNGAGLLMPGVSKNTLLSVVTMDAEGPRAGGQYWDAIIWAVGAWHYWLFTGDKDFRDFTTRVTINSLRYFESTEYDPAKGLFRGPACYGDGVSAYPARYAAGDSCILYFTEAYPERCVAPGYGIPMFTLSTNCLYYEAYRIAHWLTGDEAWRDKAEKLRRAINDSFWNETQGQYDYLLDDQGRCEFQEALGVSFALLFGIADECQAARILESMVITPQGIPCVHPSFERYRALGYGRHSGTVWPHAQAFWATAVVKRDPAAFEHELMALTRNALRDNQFAEIYHPVSGLPYGGVQENHGIMDPHWVSQPHQTWSATGYLRMILNGLAGLSFSETGLSVNPARIQGVQALSLTGLRWRGRVVNLDIRNFGASAFVPADGEGPVDLSL